MLNILRLIHLHLCGYVHGPLLRHAGTAARAAGAGLAVQQDSDKNGIKSKLKNDIDTCADNVCFGMLTTIQNKARIVS